MHSRATALFFAAIVLGSTGSLGQGAPAVPMVVQQLADKYISSLPRSALPSGRTAADQTYWVFFFEGFTSPGSQMLGKKGIPREAFDAGQAYWRSHPDKRKEIMLGFGYSEVALEGTWLTGFEASRFVPKRAPESRYWLQPLEGAGSEISLSPKGTVESQPVRVRGYLSPPGRYGHMGMYDRQIFATRIARGGG